MANRSHIYALSFDRTQAPYTEDKLVYDLSEYPYSIPLAFKILASQQSRLSPSIIWDYEHPIAIIADFQKGLEKLCEFVERLITRRVLPPLALKQQLEETKTFLKEHQLQYILLEAGEIFQMSERAVEISNQKFFEEEIQNIDQLCDDFLQKCIDYKDKKAAQKPSFFGKLFAKKKINEEEVDQAQQELFNDLGINYWSDVLYYHFGNKRKKEH